MPDSLSVLEKQRSLLLQQISELGDFRSGSITAVMKRCGKPTCHCAQAKDPGHGPNLRLTYKVKGKTVTETLGAAALQKARQEIAAFRAFQQHLPALVEVNAAICRLRPIPEEEPQLSNQEKKRRKRFKKRSAAK